MRIQLTLKRFKAPFGIPTIKVMNFFCNQNLHHYQFNRQTHLFTPKRENVTMTPRMSTARNEATIKDARRLSLDVVSFKARVTYTWSVSTSQLKDFHAENNDVRCLFPHSAEETGSWHSTVWFHEASTPPTDSGRVTFGWGIIIRSLTEKKDFQFLPWDMRPTHRQCISHHRFVQLWLESTRELSCFCFLRFVCVFFVCFGFRPLHSFVKWTQ